jgi:hypothetical protein
MTTLEERQTILAELEGTLGRAPTPDDIIEAAESPEHPLHGDFEWDDSKAGHRWRQAQARAILRTVQVISIIHGKTVRHVRYVHNPDAGHHQGYINVATVEPRSAEALRVLQMCVGRIRSHIRTARSVAAVLGLEHELQVLLEQLLVIERAAAAKAQRKKSRKKARA